MSDNLHITLAQINPVVGALAPNAAAIRATLEALPAQTRLAVFPELAICGYPPEDLVLKPSFLDAVDAEVANLAAACADRPAFLLPAPWRRDGQVYNACHLIEGGRVRATVLKHHLPNYGVFDERRVFAPGPLPEPIAFRNHRLGVMICEDMWFPDVAAHLKSRGADMLIVPNASPFELGKPETRLTVARARAAETGLPLLYVNQCGGQDELVFDGGSFALNETGQMLLQGEFFAEGLYSTTWERNTGGAWLGDAGIRHEAGPEPEMAYRAAMTGLRDYVIKNSFPGVLIGMSGGIDSALSAALAVDALGAESVHCVMMPSRFTSRESLEDAEACTRALGAFYETIAIEEPVQSFNAALSAHLPPGAPSITFENLQSRARGMVLMALSNATGRMVLSTGNKSEMAVGYATLYGDMCGGFNALKDIYKTLVYDMSRWRNAHRPAHGLGPHGVVIPDRILTKAPTAELKPGQTDQDTLPPYDVLDAILEGLIEKTHSVEEIVKTGQDRETVLRVARMLDRAEYKRRQAPPGVKITARAFGRERRYPITNGFKN